MNNRAFIGYDQWATSAPDEDDADRWMPAGALRAIRDGGDYEEEPNFEFGTMWYFLDGDSKMWNHAYIAFGYVVFDGVPYYACWQRWSCGDIEIDEMTELDDSDAENTFTQRKLAEAAGSEIAYLRWVAKTGKDPMGYFCVQREKTVDVTWTFGTSPSQDGPELLWIRKNDGPEMSPAMLIGSDAEFFLALKHGIIGGDYDEPYTWKDLCACEEIEHLEGTCTYHVASFTLQEKEGIPKEIYRAQTKELAQKQLERLDAAEEA